MVYLSRLIGEVCRNASGITLDKKMQRQSLEWIREQNLSPDCIESLATHDTDVQPHVIEL